MKYLLLLLFSAITFHATAQLATDSVRNCPEIPSLRELMTKVVTAMKDLTVEEEVRDHVTYRTYFDATGLCTGWAYTLNTQTAHKFRFTLIEKGKVIREVGYYGSGQVDFDFNFEGDNKSGCHIMWRENGTLYIDEFYVDDKPHGWQLRIAADGTVVRKEYFVNGVLSSE